jgi:hypothetical protein
MNMIEKVAKAMREKFIERAVPLPGPKDHAWHTDMQSLSFDDLARAALLALREPCAEMVAAGVQHRLGTSIGADNYWPEDTAQLFQKMLDAALAEGEEK